MRRGTASMRTVTVETDRLTICGPPVDDHGKGHGKKHKKKQKHRPDPCGCKRHPKAF